MFEDPMAKPIFVIGKHRSGTKWLSNTIAAHKDIACILHEHHFGILEVSDVFERMPLIYGDLSIAENCIGFIEYYGQTDFFVLTGLDKNMFYKNRPSNYSEFFRQMMDTFAEKEGKPYWVQKTDTAPMPDLIKHFPDAKFIMTIRDVRDNVKSAIGLAKGEKGRATPKVYNELFIYYLQKKRILSYQGRDNVMLMYFEDMKRDKRAVVERICNFLQIEFDENMLKNHFKQNTSYKGMVSKADALSDKDVFLMNLMIPLLSITPLWLMEFLYKIKTRLLGHSFLKPENRILHSFKLKKRDLGWE